MIHVCFCFCDKTGRYAKFAGTSMLSLFENTRSKVTVHILHDNTLTDENRDKFYYIVGKYNQLVEFYNLDELCLEQITKIKKFIPDVEKSAATIGTFYKLLIPQVLPEKIKGAIFIDPDTIVNLDINELWQNDLGDKVLGVVTEMENGANPNKAFLLCSEGTVKDEDYFNGGVLLMNLELLRNEQETIMQGIKFRGEYPKHKYFEQTVLNYCFSERTLKLPVKFNRFVRLERSAKEEAVSEKIYHYAGGASRPGLDMKDPFNRLWMSYFIKTPFFNEETIGSLFARLQKIRNDVKELPLKLATTMPGKMRTFFIEPQKVASMKKFFAIQDYEEIILAEDESSLQKLIDTMRNYKGMSVFFILTENFLRKKFPFERLNKEGFQEDRDFVKAWRFLTEAQGVPFDIYPFIQAM